MILKFMMGGVWIIMVTKKLCALDMYNCNTYDLTLTSTIAFHKFPKDLNRLHDGFFPHPFHILIDCSTYLYYTLGHISMIYKYKKKVYYVPK